MSGRVCELHQEYCPEGVCRWCEPLDPPAEPTVVDHNGVRTSWYEPAAEPFVPAAATWSAFGLYLRDFPS